MAFTTAPFPTKDAIVDRLGRATGPFIDWVTSLVGDVDSSPARLVAVELPGQTAAIGTTPFNTGSLAEGLYRVSWTIRPTTPATTSSSLTVTIGYTRGAASCTVSGPALTSNAVNAPQSGSVLIHIDAASPVTYAVAYASVGATSLVYEVDFVLEQVDA